MTRGCSIQHSPAANETCSSSSAIHPSQMLYMAGCISEESDEPQVVIYIANTFVVISMGQHFIRQKQPCCLCPCLQPVHACIIT
jgi:hypothetical protein